MVMRILLLAVVVALTVMIQCRSADASESFTPVSTQTTHYVKVSNIIRETEASTAPAETRQTQIGQAYIFVHAAIVRRYGACCFVFPKDVPDHIAE